MIMNMEWGSRGWDSEGINGEEGNF